MADTFTFPDENEEDTVAGAADEAAKKQAAGTDDIEVEVVDDTPDKDKGRKPLEKPVEEPTDEELAAYSDKVQSRIKELTHARHDERRVKEKLERENAELSRLAAQVIADRDKLRAQVQLSGKVVAEQNISSAAQRVADAKRAIKEAAEAFDVDAQVEAQEKLAEALADAREAKNLQARALQAPQDAVQTPHVPQRTAVQDPKTLSWQAENQWFDQPGYEEVTSFALGLHNKLVNQGVAPSSDEYFTRLNARMHAKFPELYDSPAGDGNTQRKKPAAVVAPAGRSAGVRKITLTASQVALANRFNVPLQEYARQVALLENDNG